MSISLSSTIKRVFDKITILWETQEKRERRWIKEGEVVGATHVIVVEDKIKKDAVPQPRFVHPHEDVTRVANLIEETSAHFVGRILRIPPP